MKLAYYSPVSAWCLAMSLGESVRFLHQVIICEPPFFSPRFLSVKWKLCVTETSGQEHWVSADDVSYFASSVSIRWYSLQLPSLPKLKSLKIYAFVPLFYHRNWKPHVNRYMYIDTLDRKVPLFKFLGKVRSRPAWTLMYVHLCRTFFVHFSLVNIASHKTNTWCLTWVHR